LTQKLKKPSREKKTYLTLGKGKTKVLTEDDLGSHPKVIQALKSDWKKQDKKSANSMEKFDPFAFSPPKKKTS